MSQVIVDKQLLNQIVKYLAIQPYEEVYTFIARLQNLQEVETAKEIETTKEDK